MGNIIINPGTIIGDISQHLSQNPSQIADGNSENSNSSAKDTSLTEKVKVYSDEKRVSPKKDFKYDVAISYASEQEQYVRRVAKILEKENLVVFYAPNREEEFLGKDMIVEFYQIYRYDSMFVVSFISDEYLKKDFTMHEAKTALLREKEEKRNCLIPVCLGNSWGDARVLGLDSDIHYLNGDRLKEVEVADKIKLIVNSFMQQYYR